MPIGFQISNISQIHLTSISYFKRIRNISQITDTSKHILHRVRCFRCSVSCLFVVCKGTPPVLLCFFHESRHLRAVRLSPASSAPYCIAEVCFGAPLPICSWHARGPLPFGSRAARTAGFSFRQKGDRSGAIRLCWSIIAQKQNSQNANGTIKTRPSLAKGVEDTRATWPKRTQT